MASARRWKVWGLLLGCWLPSIVLLVFATVFFFCGGCVMRGSAKAAFDVF